MSRCLPKRLPRGTISFNRYITFLLAMSGATFLTAAAHNKAWEAMLKRCTHLCCFLPPLSPRHHQRHHPWRTPTKLVWLQDVIRGYSGIWLYGPRTNGSLGWALVKIQRHRFVRDWKCRWCRGCWARSGGFTVAFKQCQDLRQIKETC